MQAPAPRAFRPTRLAPAAARWLKRLALCLSALVMAAAAARAQSFATPVGYAVGTDAQGVVLGDFDRDGKPDIAVASRGNASVGVLRNKGDGTFHPAVNYPIGSLAKAIAAADFNRDGALDLVVADPAQTSNPSYSVLLGNGDGTFRPRVTSDTGGSSDSIAVGDFNGDGKPDLASVFGLNSVSVLLGNGDGTLQPNVFYLIGPQPREVVARDFNGDGRTDVAAVTEGDSGAGVAVLISNADGTLRPRTIYDAETDFVAQLTADDFNGDGVADLAATSTFSGGRITVLVGNGDGTFRAGGNALSAGSDKLASADADGDGRVDLLTIQGRGRGDLGVVPGNGDGTFRPVKTYTITGNPLKIAPGDLNGDGRVDLVTLHFDSVSVILNQTGPHRIGGVVTDQNGAPLPGVTMTLTGPGPRVVTPTAADGSYSFAGLTAGASYTVTPTRPNYTMSPQQQTFGGLAADQTANFTATLRAFSITGSVFDGSGTGVGGVTVLLALGQGGATISTTTGADGRFAFTNLPAGGNYTVGPSMPRRVFNPPSVIINNLNANRTVGFLMKLALHSISVRLVDPANPDEFLMPFTATLSGTVNATSINGFPNLPVGGNYTVTAGQAVGPFTNFLLAPPPSQTFNDLASNQTATFNARALSFPAGPGAGELAEADFNGDGRRDLFVLNHTAEGGNASLLLGEGDGTMRAPLAVTTGGPPSDLAVADFNGDGKPDAAVSHPQANSLSVMLGNGDGTFRAPAFYATGTRPMRLAAADFNGDGRADLAAGYNDTFAAFGVSILLGNGDGTFRPKVDHALGSYPNRLTAAHLDGDGKLDLVAGVYAMLGNGDGTLRAPVAFSADLPSSGDAPSGSAVADFDGDGRADLAASARNQSGVEVRLGNGDGTFRAPALQPTGGRVGQMVMGDFNGDGRHDLALVSSFRLNVLSGNGDGTFQNYEIWFSNVLSPVRLASADFNRDGRPDFAITDAAGSRRVNVLLNQMRASVQFSATAYAASEADGRALVAVRRGGDTSAAATVSYTTVDDVAPIRCDVVNGRAFARCDYATSVDTLDFAPGETVKTIAVPIINDAHAEGSETFQITFTATTGGVLSGQHTATVTILDDDAAAGANPVAANSFFVRQQYLDFLSREPEAGEPWTGVLARCPNVNNDSSCDRLTVSQSFFQSPEFQLKGFYVYRFFAVGLRRLPTYDEVVAAMRGVTGQTGAEVFAKRRAFAEGWMERQDMAFYRADSNQSFVTSLMNAYELAQISAPDPLNPEGEAKVLLKRSDLIARLDAGTLTRAQVLRAIVESDEVSAAEYNRAFVSMQYYGYLRRDPDSAGFQAWLNYLNAHPGDFRTMVNGFVNSQEYALRFGRP